MIVIHATIKAQPGKEDILLGHLRTLIAASNQEQGVLKYVVGEDITEGGTFHLMEEYKDQEALDWHIQSEHFQAIGAVLGDLLATPPEIKQYEIRGWRLLDV